MRKALTATYVAGFILSAMCTGAAADDSGVAQTFVSGSPGVFADDTRSLPPPAPWQPGDGVRVRPPRRITHPQAAPGSSVPQHELDPLLDLQRAGRRSGVPRVYNPPELNFDAAGFTGVVPPDTNGDIGSNYYIQLINNDSSSVVTIYHKDGTVASGPFTLSSLWAAGGECAVGAGDPIVLYDPLASRWLISEFASNGNHLCIYLSRNNDPISGGWLNYDFPTFEFPDYPKYSVWPDAYYVTTNETAPTVYAFDRNQMLAGLPATSQRFTAPGLSGFSFQSLTPADVDGTTAPPLGSKAFFVRHKDDEVNPPAVPGSDQLEVWELHIDFATPANSTFSLATSIPVTEFDSDLCGTSNMDCIPQPGTTTLLDPLREIVMWRAQYRNFGAYETLVGNFVTDVDGTDHAGIRWFELRRVGAGAWTLFQEGTYAPDANHRWTGSIAMDHAGNMVLGFSVASSTVFPGIRYTGRHSGDAAGVMTQPEVTAMSGGASQDIDRWGDYASMTVDPVDDCTFWFTTEYVPIGGDWQTRVMRLRYDAPTCTDASAPTCGNNTKEVGEDCDGTDASFCPGLCSGSCQCPTPVCGNDVKEVGEACDGTSLGSCVACNPDCTCKLCGVAPEPGAGCYTQTVALKASVQIFDDSDDTKDKLKWTWSKGAGTATANFGNPVVNSGPHYDLCIYDSSANPQPLMDANVAPGGTCGSKPCWKPSSTGYTYKNKDGNGNGITQLSLRAGAPGKSLVKAQGKGVNLHPANPILTLPVTVQLTTDSGNGLQCWQTIYTAATKNNDQQFQAKGP